MFVGAAGVGSRRRWTTDGGQGTGSGSASCASSRGLPPLRRGRPRADHRDRWFNNRIATHWLQSDNDGDALGQGGPLPVSRAAAPGSAGQAMPEASARVAYSGLYFNEIPRRIR